MKYFLATVITKGKKEKIPLYAENKKDAQTSAATKSSGILIKVEEADEPLDAQFERFKNNVFML